MVGFVLSLRLLMLFASVGAFMGALLMFWEGWAKLWNAFRQLLHLGDQEGAAATLVLAATDSFLFGIVLVIFAYAIAFGFVFEIEAAQRERLPQWMRVDGVTELKHTLVQVILVYLVVDFATDVAEHALHLSWQTLVMPLSILLLAGALRLMIVPHRPSNG
jgi:uncharacterized membrane protein YqhA